MKRIVVPILLAVLCLSVLFGSLLTFAGNTESSTLETNVTWTPWKNTGGGQFVCTETELSAPESSLALTACSDINLDGTESFTFELEYEVLSTAPVDTANIRQGIMFGLGTPEAGAAGTDTWDDFYAFKIYPKRAEMGYALGFLGYPLAAEDVGTTTFNIFLSYDVTTGKISFTANGKEIVSLDWFDGFNGHLGIYSLMSAIKVRKAVFISESHPATAEPTAAPTVAPTAAPTVAPTAAPTTEPTIAPTAAPTAEPTAVPDPIDTNITWTPSFDAGAGQFVCTDTELSAPETHLGLTAYSDKFLDGTESFTFELEYEILSMAPVTDPTWVTQGIILGLSAPEVGAAGPDSKWNSFYAFRIFPKRTDIGYGIGFLGEPFTAEDVGATVFNILMSYDASTKKLSFTVNGDEKVVLDWADAYNGYFGIMTVMTGMNVRKAIFNSASNPTATPDATPGTTTPPTNPTTGDNAIAPIIIAATLAASAVVIMLKKEKKEAFVK